MESILDEELFDILDTFAGTLDPSDPLLLSLLTGPEENQGAAGQLAVDAGKDGTGSGQIPQIPLWGDALASTSPAAQQGGAALPTAPAHPFSQPALHAASLSHPARAPSTPGAAAHPSSKPAATRGFLLDAAALAAPLQREGSTLLHGILASDFSRQFEAVAARAAGGGGGPAPAQGAPEAFLQQLLGSGSFPIFEDELDLLEGKPRPAFLPQLDGANAGAAGGSPGAGAAAHAMLELPGVDGSLRLPLGSSSLPPLGSLGGSLQLDQLFEQLASGGFPEPTAPLPASAAPAPTCASSLPPPAQRNRGVGSGSSAPAYLTTLPSESLAAAAAAAATAAAAAAATAAAAAAATAARDTEATSSASGMRGASSSNPSLATTATASGATAPTAANGDMFAIPSHYVVPPGAEGEALHFPQLAPDGTLVPGEWPVGTQAPPTPQQPWQPPPGAHPVPLATAHIALASDASEMLSPGAGAASYAGGAASSSAFLFGGPSAALTGVDGAPAGSAAAGPPPRQRAGAGRASQRQQAGEEEQGEQGLALKQIKAREAQKRFREKQKARVRETEEGLERMAAEIEREQAARESALLTHEVYEHMMVYKDHMMAALQAANEEEASPAEPIPEMEEALIEFGADEVFPVEELQRYKVEGDTGKRDSQGRATQAPDFEKVAKEYSHIVAQLKAMVEEARLSGQAVVQRIGEARLAAAAAEQGRAVAGAAQALAPPENQQLQLRTGVSWEQVLQYAKRYRLRRSSTSGGSRESGGSLRETREGEMVELGGRPFSVSPGSGAAAAGTATGAGDDPAALESLQKSVSSVMLRRELALRVASATLAATGTLREGSAVYMDSRERAYLEALLKRMLVAATMRGAQPWTLVEGGLLTQEREGAYFLTGAQLRRLTRLLRQAGSLLWQQALLFPDNLLKLAAMRIDTGEAVCDDKQDATQWEQLVEELDLKPSQLADILAMHKEFMSHCRPARRQRRELFHEMAQVQLRMMTLGMASTQNHTLCTLALSELNNLMRKTTQDEMTAYVTFCAGMFRVMLFPLQKVKVFLYAWPYFPQMHLIGVAVAKKLGVEPPFAD